jgi:Flp pilus assembly protein TadD
MQLSKWLLLCLSLWCTEQAIAAQINVKKQKAESFNKEGISHVQKNDHESAKIAFQKASELEPNNPQRW